MIYSGETLYALMCEIAVEERKMESCIYERCSFCLPDATVITLRLDEDCDILPLYHLLIAT